MFQELNEQIIQAKGVLHKKRKLEMKLEDFQNELSDVEQTINRLNSLLKDEEKDVKKLEGISIANLLSTITGTKYEKLDKENREVLAVKLQLDSAVKAGNEIRESIMEVKTKLADVNQSDLEYEELLNRKEQLIIESGSQFAEDLYAISDREGDIEAYIKELKEAINAGNYAADALHNAEESLDSAAGWGTWDMLGGGMISSAIKHSRMDDASDHIAIAQTRMRNFQKELLDINEMIHVDMDISGLLKFADFFFDGFIVDWMVQGRINDSLDQVYDQVGKVEKIVNTLEKELLDREQKLAELQHEKKLLIENL
ncbi:hypothetical protein [Paucisalibacillus globulus]|uniref:hypothetical protein n=1 Tax=Paucisalibacillus globulus TaxID=351095 RepID=UPI0003FE2169|nr:hypothetical protein [Paucisalibacillus globulus]